MLLQPSDIRNIVLTKFALVGTNSQSNKSFNRRFHAAFGCSPRIVAIAWNTIIKQQLLPEKGRTVHLLWTLAFLKLYNTENFFSSWLHVDEKTFRKWVNLFLKALEKIKLVSTNVTLLLLKKELPYNSNVFLLRSSGKIIFCMTWVANV
jgi:hypothetical protein